MKNAGTFLEELQSGALNGRMIEIYGCDPDKAQGYADRFAKVIKGFQVTFPANAQAQIGLYSAPGRTEIGGNHTDHQYGCVLAASVNLDAIAAAALNGTNVIRFYSEGYGMIEADLSVLEPVEAEKESTLALIRGMAALAIKRGYEVKGIDVYCTSNVLGGSGLSSSAAFEVVIGNILDPEAMAGWNRSFASDSVIYALIVCSIVPILIIYPFIQKYFAKGTNVGGVKE